MRTQINTAMLNRLYPDKSNKEIAMILNVSVSNVAVTAHRLGLKKNPEYLSRVNREIGIYGLNVRYGKVRILPRLDVERQLLRGDLQET